MKLNLNEALKGVRFSEIAIETMYGYMNYHLELLHRAINDSDNVEITFQKEQLEKVRQRLLELEYFNFMGV